MKTLCYIIPLLLALQSIQCYGQTFNITGTVLDGANNQSIPGAYVTITDTKDSSKTIGTATELTGTFSLSAGPGTYKLKIASVGYQDLSQTLNVVDKDVNI